jgi:hypothetical protein
VTSNGSLKAEEGFLQHDVADPTLQLDAALGCRHPGRAPPQPCDPDLPRRGPPGLRSGRLPHLAEQLLVPQPVHLLHHPHALHTPRPSNLPPSTESPSFHPCSIDEQPRPHRHGGGHQLGLLRSAYSSTPSTSRSLSRRRLRTGSPVAAEAGVAAV